MMSASTHQTNRSTNNCIQNANTNVCADDDVAATPPSRSHRRSGAPLALLWAQPLLLPLRPSSHPLSGHGESFESNPNECIGNNGYQPPMRLPTMFILAIDSSAPPRPWLCSKPTHFCHTIITRLRPSKSPVCACASMAELVWTH